MFRRSSASAFSRRFWFIVLPLAFIDRPYLRFDLSRGQVLDYLLHAIGVGISLMWDDVDTHGSRSCFQLPTIDEFMGWRREIWWGLVWSNERTNKTPNDKKKLFGGELGEECYVLTVMGEDVPEL